MSSFGFRFRLFDVFRRVGNATLQASLRQCHWLNWWRYDFVAHDYLLDVCLLFRVVPRDVARVDTVAAVRSFIAVAMRSPDSAAVLIVAVCNARAADSLANRSDGWLSRPAREPITTATASATRPNHSPAQRPNQLPCIRTRLNL